MTDNDIIKALECCGKNRILGKISECKNCYLQNNTLCVTELIYQSLDLINRQKAEVEQYKDYNEKLFEQNEELKYDLELMKQEKSVVVAEAITELETKLTMRFGTYTDKDCLRVFDMLRLIKQIAKEMKEGVWE